VVTFKSFGILGGGGTTLSHSDGFNSNYLLGLLDSCHWSMDYIYEKKKPLLTHTLPPNSKIGDIFTTCYLWTVHHLKINNAQLILGGQFKLFGKLKEASTFFHSHGFNIN